MPWMNGDAKLLREEFVHLATQPGANVSQLCQQFQIRRKTGYKWIDYSRQPTSKNFADHSKKPHHIVHHVSQETKEQIIATRCVYPHWGAKKIKAYLLNRHVANHLPSIRTINKILAQEELMKIHHNERHFAYKRFEHAYPNALWQMDFKGYFSLLDGSNCHPLTILDDYSRYLICLASCTDESLKVVQPLLLKTFSHYGLPDAIALDN